MAKIFLSYRRQDTQDVTGRIYDRLLRHFGTEDVFKDVDSIGSGDDYKDVIDLHIAECSVLLAVIGPAWIQATNKRGQRRLDDSNDLVRQEIETALNRGKRVIPVLVGAAQMPQREDLPDSLGELADRHAHAVRADPDFHPDMDRLVERIQASIRPPELVRAEPVEPAPTPGNPFYQPPIYQPPIERLRPSLFGPMVALFIACGAGLMFCSFLMFGTYAADPARSGSTTAGADHFVNYAAVAGWFGNLFGLCAGVGLHTRRSFWRTVLCLGAMSLGTLIFCALLNLPAAIWALIAMWRPETRASFGKPTWPA